MTRFDLLKRTDAPLAASLILMLAREFPDEDVLARHLQGEVSEAELQRINGAAQREGGEKMDSIQMRIKNRREALGLSQYELAKRTKKLNQSQISKIETENRKIAIEDMMLIAEALETPLGWFTEQSEKEVRQE